MNRLGKGPTLTWIFIGLIIGTTIAMMSFNSYFNFLEVNNKTSNIDTYIEGANLTNQTTNIQNLVNTSTDRGLVTTALAIGTGIVNTFVVGLKSIVTLFEMIPIITDILNVLQTVVPGIEIIIGLAILVATVYITMAYIKAARGTGSEA